MKATVFILFTLLFVSSIHAQKSEIVFLDGNFEDALNEARESNKLVYVDCKTSWCRPCKAMEKEVFTNDNVAKFYNQHFVSISLDMDKEGGSVKDEFHVSAYPTHLFIDPNRQMIHRAMGYQSSSQFVTTGQNAIGKGEIKPNGLLVKEYECGNRDSDFLLSYHKFLVKNGLPADLVFDEYLKAIPGNELNSERVVKLLMKTHLINRSYAYSRLVVLSEQGSTTEFSRSDLKMKRKSVITESAKRAIQTDDEYWIKELIDECASLNDPELSLSEVEIPYLVKTRNVNELIHAVNQLSMVFLGDSLADGIEENPECKLRLKMIQKKYKRTRIIIESNGKSKRQKLNTLAEDYFKWYTFLNEPKNGLPISNDQMIITQEWLKIAYLIRKDKKYLID